MVSGISSQTTSLLYLQQTNSGLSGSSMFSKLSNELNITDGSDITSDQLDAYIKEIESSDSADKGKLGFLYQLQDNFDTVAGDDGTISSSDMENNIDLLKPPSNSGANATSSTDFYSKLLEDLGLDDGDEISEDALSSLIEELENSDDSEDSEKLGFLKQLQENFSTIAGDDGTISESDLSTNLSLLQPPTKPTNEWLDPSEITSQMLESPIDLKV